MTCVSRTNLFFCLRGVMSPSKASVLFACMLLRIPSSTTAHCMLASYWCSSSTAVDIYHHVLTCKDSCQYADEALPKILSPAHSFRSLSLRRLSHANSGSDKLFRCCHAIGRSSNSLVQVQRRETWCKTTILR